MGMTTNPSDAEKSRTNDPKANPDPMTGEPGAHPLGTGVGAAGAGLAGAAIGAVAGPIGSLAGAVVGAVVGGLAGKGVGEAMNPTEEAKYWREAHARQPYATPTDSYDNYADAYRVGYEGHSKYGPSDKSFDSAETTLMSDYRDSKSPIEWERAKPAAKAAWSRRQEKAQGN